MDINENRLKLAYNYARKYSGKIHIDMNFKAITSLSDAIANSDFTIISAMSGGDRCYEMMKEATERKEYYRGINRSSGLRKRLNQS